MPEKYQEEIEEIVETLKIQQYFKKMIGAPTSKIEAIKSLIEEYSIRPDSAVMIGDSSSDYEAATANQVPFVLRKTKFNKELQEKLDCFIIEDFCNA